MADGDSRRRLLHATDHLLERVEELRLQNVIKVPKELRAQVASVSSEIHSRARVRPSTVAATHDHLFELQARLLRSRMPRRPPRDPRTGQPTPTGVVTTPALEIPPRGGSEADWRERVRLVVQRAHDRFLYLGAQTEAAGKPGAEAEDLAARRRAQASEALGALGRLSLQAEEATGGPVVLDEPAIPPSSGRLEYGDIAVDLDTGTVTQASRSVPLTRYERAILTVLIANQGRVVTREAMQLLVCGDDARVEAGSRSLDVHLAALRAKLGRPAFLETIPGIGHRAAAAAPSITATAGSDVPQTRRARRRAGARDSTASPPPGPASPGPTSTRRAGR